MVDITPVQAGSLITELDGTYSLVIDNGTSVDHIHEDNLFKRAALKRTNETAHDYGSVSSAFTHDTDSYGNNCKLTLGAAITINVPTATLTGEQGIGGVMRIAGGDTYTITWSGSFDWGAAGAPAAAADIIVVFYRRNGDTTTLARWI